MLIDELLVWDLVAVGNLLDLLLRLATYGMVGFMREQVCKYMCPYARFQA